jgi:penicillin amidase
VDDHVRLIALAEAVRGLMGISNRTGEGLGSNNWVIDGTKTTTGKPILANDPHLGTGIPTVWYLAHLTGGDLDVIGTTVPGLPAVVIGRNKDIAWGVTSLAPDTQDLYKERLDPTGTMAEFRGRMEPMQLVMETIKVRGKPDVTVRVRITRHGPLISDALNENAKTVPADQRPGEREPLALRWSGLDPGDTTILSFLKLDRAKDWRTFQDALRDYITPAQNFVYADTAGNIGYTAPGRIPIRATGDGSLPAEGWTGVNEWTAWVPFEKLPRLYNPPAHMIVTANNRPVPEDCPVFLGREWQPPYRAERITELLRAKAKLSPDDMAAIQGDTLSGQARQLLPELLALAGQGDPGEGDALALLRSWDCNMRPESPAAALYAAWTRRLPRAIAGDELGPKLMDAYEPWFMFTSGFLKSTCKSKDNSWFDDVGTPRKQDGTMVVRATLREAIAELKKTLGADMRTWRWDKLHLVRFPHQPFDKVPPLRPVFDRTVAFGGDQSTVNAGPFSYAPPYYEQEYGAMYRQIVDMSDPDGGRFLQAVGQSGHMLSPHYDDYMADWRAVRYRPMRFTNGAVESGTHATLRLAP